MTNRSSGSCGGREFLRGRATPVIEGICCEKIRGCSYRKAMRLFPLRPMPTEFRRATKCAKTHALVSSSR
jgi:hypothetical protein